MSKRKRKRKHRPARLIPAGRLGTKRRRQFPFSIAHQTEIAKHKEFEMPLQGEWERGTPSVLQATVLLNRMKAAGVTTAHQVGRSVYGQMHELLTALEVAGYETF